MSIKERTLNRFTTSALAGCLLFISGCVATKGPAIESAETKAPSVQAGQHPLSGKIFAVNSGKEISYDALLQQLRKNRFILIGEKHDNPQHHIRELQLLQDLQNKTKTRLVLEMLDEQQGENIPELSPSSSETQIQSQLSWNDRNWPWQDYGPLISSALTDSNQLKAGNLSKPELMHIYQHGLPDEPRLATASAIPEGIRSTIQQQVYDSHCQTIPLEQMGPMTDIQLSRDASMAYALSNDLEEPMQAILIAGAFHARKDTGVPQHLQQRTSEAVVSILLTETDDTVTTAAEAINNNADMADFIWLTPRTEEKDYCASLRQQSHKKDD